MNNIYYLIHSKSFGDTLAATPTLRYLSQSHNQKINVVTYKKHIFKNNHITPLFSNRSEFFCQHSNYTKPEYEIFPLNELQQHLLLLEMALIIRVIFSILFTYSIVKRALKRKTLSSSGCVTGNPLIFFC